MELSDVVTLIGIGLTFAVSVFTLVYTVIRNRRSDYISNVTDYRLKWIDQVRTPISEYLLILDKLSRGNDKTLDDDFDVFLNKHWQIQSFLTAFSPKDRGAQEQISILYESVSMLMDSKRNDRDAIRAEIHKNIPEADAALRKLMDENWFGVKDEVI